MQNVPAPVAMTIEADSFTGMLTQMRDVLCNTDGHPVRLFDTRVGEMAVSYNHDDDGIFARLEFKLPEGVLVEIEGETYAEQDAYRIYIAEHNSEVVSDHGYGVRIANGGAIEIRDGDGNHVEDVDADDARYGQLFSVVVTGNRE